MINEHNLNIGDRIWVILGKYIYHCTVIDKIISCGIISYELDRAMGSWEKDSMFHTKLEALEVLYKINHGIDIDTTPPYWD